MNTKAYDAVSGFSIADSAIGSVSDQPIWIGANGWPTLGDVIQEAVDWRAKNTPDEFGFVNSLQSAEEITGRFGTP